LTFLMALTDSFFCDGTIVRGSSVALPYLISGFG